MAQFDRRKFLQASGAGLAGILASHQAPVFAQQSTVHWLKWNDFVPASDELLRKTMLPEAMKALGVKINLETINGNDLRSEEHTSELSHITISYAVFCLKKK